MNRRTFLSTAISAGAVLASPFAYVPGSAGAGLDPKSGGGRSGPGSVTGRYENSAAGDEASNRVAASVRLSVCIDMIMTEIPFLDRMSRVKQLGYPAFEFWEWKNKDLDAIQKKKDEPGLEIATMMGSGWKQLFTEDARKTFVADIKASTATATRLGVKTLIVTTGSEDKNLSRADQHKAYVEALKAAAPIAEQAGVTLVLEPLNTKVDHPGYYLTTAREGFEILDEVASPAV